MQRIREAERDSVYLEYVDRAGEILNGVVRNIDARSGNVTLSLGKAEATLPRSEQIPGEHYRLNQRLRVYLAEVERTGHGPQITASRTNRGLLRRLFEMEVPEIFSGTVEVKAVKKGVYTTAVSPSPFPQVSDPDTPYWIRISPGGTHDLNENFTLTGQTNLPAGYPLVMEIYPGVFSLDKFSFDVDYDPMVREIIPVRLDDDGISVFSLPVNLTERSAQTGRELTLGSYFTEVHAVNMNSTVSDQGIFQATTTGPWVAIDPFPEPVQGTNLTISGRTNLSAGSNVVVSIDTLMHPCFKCSSPESNPGSYCCGA